MNLRHGSRLGAVLAAIGLAFALPFTRSFIPHVAGNLAAIVLFFGTLLLAGLIGLWAKTSRGASMLAALFLALSFTAAAEGFYWSWRLGLNNWPGEDHVPQGFLTHLWSGVAIWNLPVMLIGAAIGRVGWAMGPSRKSPPQHTATTG